MNAVKIMCFLVVMVLFSSCVTTTGATQLSQFTTEKVNNLIVDGKTTQQEVIGIFGSSYSIEEDNKGREKWIYKLKKNSQKKRNFVPYVNQLSCGVNHTFYKLIVIFDDDGTVVKHRFHAYTEETKAGALAGF